MSDAERFLMRFADGRARGDAMWNGPWPLPDEIWVCKGMQTGLVAHVVPADHDKATLGELAEFSDIEKYRKCSESQLSDEDMEGATHVMRGAEYRVLERAS